MAVAAAVRCKAILEVEATCKAEVEAEAEAIGGSLAKEKGWAEVRGLPVTDVWCGASSAR